MGNKEGNRCNAAASAALDGVVEGQGLAGSAAESLELGGSEAASLGWAGLLPGTSTTSSSEQQQQQQQQHSQPSQQAAEPPRYMQPQQAAARGTSAYQAQLHRHMDALAGRLSSFQRAVEEARAVGQRASQQVRFTVQLGQVQNRLAAGLVVLLSMQTWVHDLQARNMLGFNV
jgi:hypothetical protein